MIGSAYFIKSLYNLNIIIAFPPNTPNIKYINKTAIWPFSSDLNIKYISNLDKNQKYIIVEYIFLQ